MLTQQTAARLHTGTIADVLDGLQIWGVLPSQLRRLSGRAQTFFGRAYTVQWGWTRKGDQIKADQKSTWDQVKRFLVPDIQDGRGRVYVAGTACGFMTDMALAGGLSAKYLQNLGFEGMILGGAIRDAHALEELAIPVLATNFAPADTQGCFQVLEVGTECSVGSMRVRTGDWVLADRTGAVVIPDELLTRVVEKALEIEGIEDEIERRLDAKQSLWQMIEESSGRI